MKPYPPTLKPGLYRIGIRRHDPRYGSGWTPYGSYGPLTLDVAETIVKQLKLPTSDTHIYRIR